MVKLTCSLVVKLFFVICVVQSGRVAVKLTDVDKSEDKLLAVQVVGLGTKWLAELNEILNATIQKASP